jgi:hypothetical protein
VPPPSAGDGGAAMQMLVNAINCQFGADRPAPMQEARRLRAWALVHGLAMLMLDGQVPADPALIDVVVDARFI